MTEPTWEVDLYIDGPVTIRHRLNTTQQKGFHTSNPFYSDIEMMAAPTGIRAKLTARALDQELAFEAAVFFFGRMLDVLSLKVDQPMHLSLTERHSAPHGRARQQVRRVVELPEIEDSFQEAHHLDQNSPTFLRGLGWYRKGNYTEDPFDKFLAFWNAIEIVASRCYRYVPGIDIDRAKKGVKNQVRVCFDRLWGECESWPIIPGEDNWIDEYYTLRSEIAHGATSVDIEKVAEVSAKIGTLRRVAHRFLLEGRQDLLSLDCSPPREADANTDDEVSSY